MDKEQRKTLATRGYLVEDMVGLRTVPKLTYYKPNGEALPNLPADPYHMKRYLDRGLTLRLPVNPVKTVGQPVGVTPLPLPSVGLPQDKIICETCGKEFKSKLGLIGHSRSHKKEK